MYFPHLQNYSFRLLFSILRSKGGTCVFATPTGSYYWMSELCTEEKKFMCSKPTGMIINTNENESSRNVVIDFFLSFIFFAYPSIHQIFIGLLNCFISITA